MKERAFNARAEEVRGYIDGSKTQTRRSVKPQPYIDPKWGTLWEPRGKAPHCPSYCERNVSWNPISEAFLDYYRERGGSPYGIAGDRLRVRETWRPLVSRASAVFDSQKQRYAYRLDHPSPSPFDTTWKPSSQMPKGASRITLEIVNVRVERVQEISEADAKEEGVTVQSAIDHHPDFACAWVPAFASLWDSIHGKGAWERNDWVWVITHRKV